MQVMNIKQRLSVPPKGEEKIPIVDKPGSPSWKQAVKELRSARKKGNNYVASNRQQAEQLINEAMPDLPKAETYATNAPKSNYQIHPIDNEYTCHIFVIMIGQRENIMALQDIYFGRNRYGYKRI